jgi:hypothetical protein
MLEGNPDNADKIGASVADLVQDNNSKNKAALLAKLVDDIIDTSAMSEKSHITTAKFVHEFLKKFCAHKLPKNCELVIMEEKFINDPNLSIENKELHIKRKNELTKGYSLMDTLSYNFRDYQGLVADLNEKKFLIALTTGSPINIVLIKQLNHKFMQTAFNSNSPKEEIENLKDFVMAAVDLASEKDAREALKPLITKPVLKKVFDLPTAVELLPYRTLVENLSDDLSGF